MESLLLILLLSLFQISPGQGGTELYSTNDGVVSFRSDAPQEIISAQSRNLRGLIDPEKKTFVFKVVVRTFKGFNSGLQQEHFNEKYLETENFPDATFIGKIIEDADIRKEGTYVVRAKGRLNIHGIDQERIIRSTLINHGGVFRIESSFNILLTDYNIKIPRVVHEKIASEVKVEISAELRKNNP